MLINLLANLIVVSMNIELEELVPVSDFNKGKAGRIFRSVAKRGKIVVMKNNRPEAVVVSVKTWEALNELIEDLELEKIARERLAKLDESKLIPFDEVVRKCGISEEDISNTEPFEIE